MKDRRRTVDAAAASSGRSTGPPDRVAEAQATLSLAEVSAWPDSVRTKYVAANTRGFTSGFFE